MPIDWELHACIYIYTGVFHSDRDVDMYVPDMAGVCDSYRLQSHGDVDCDEDVDILNMARVADSYVLPISV